MMHGIYVRIYLARGLSLFWFDFSIFVYIFPLFSFFFSTLAVKLKTKYLWDVHFVWNSFTILIKTNSPQKMAPTLWLNYGLRFVLRSYNFCDRSNLLPCSHVQRNKQNWVADCRCSTIRQKIWDRAAHVRCTETKKKCFKT